MIRQIPNLFTLLNLLFGCIAVIFVLQTGETLVTESDNGTFSPQLPEKIWWGSIFIGLAAIVDFLDGFVARLFKATSEMGKQLDSLADVVSFGVAPGIILYQLLRISFIQEENVFQYFHQLIKQMVDEGFWKGLRIDHIDGLFDPKAFSRKFSAFQFIGKSPKRGSR